MIRSIRRAWELLTGTLWFIPLCMVLACGALSLVLVEFDRMLTDGKPSTSWIFSGGPEGARGLLSSVASSMVAAASITLSLTMVVLTMAAQQYTPRVVPEFMSDRPTQLVVGGLLGTFTYSLLTLRTVRGDSFGDFVPHVGVTVGIALALLSMGLLIFYFHHVVVNVQTPAILARIRHRTLGLIDELYPEPAGVGQEQPAAATEEAPELSGEAEVRSPGQGYVQDVDGSKLLELAARKRFLIRLTCRPGEHVVPGAPVATVRPASALDDDVVRTIQQAIPLGRDRTLRHDAEFGIRLMTDLAIKALSPSVNEPSLANMCVDSIAVVLRRMAERPQPSFVRRDEKGEVRLIAPGPTFDTMCDIAFGEITHYAQGHPTVEARLLGAIADVAVVAPPGPRREVLRRHALLLARPVEADWPSMGEAEVTRALEKAMEATEQPSPEGGPAPRGACL